MEADVLKVHQRLETDEVCLGDGDWRLYESYWV